MKEAQGIVDSIRFLALKFGPNATEHVDGLLKPFEAKLAELEKPVDAHE